MRTYPSDLRQKVKDFNPSTVDEAVDLLHRFDPRSKKPQPTKGAPFRPNTGPWKPRWREQSWKKPSTYSGSRHGTGDGTADTTQRIPVPTSDISEAKKEAVKEDCKSSLGSRQTRNYHYNGRKEASCRRCGGRGHWDKQCPSPSSLGGCPEDIRSGNIAGREVQDIIIDAGSGASIVASDMLPRNPGYT